MFEKIYEATKEASLKNLETHNKRIEERNKYLQKTTTEERIRKEDGANWQVFADCPKKADVLSEELFDIISTLKFEVLEYGKRCSEISDYEYNPTIEYYSVKYNNYKFVIKNIDDIDIEDGIFGVYEIENINTEEKIKFYVDLGCRNTGKQKLDSFLLLLNSNTEEDYLNKKYEIYRKIPELLLEKGYENVEDLVKYDIDKIRGHIKVDNLYVVPYFAWLNEIRVVVTNFNHWNVNSNNTRNEIGYYVEYNNINDIDVLVENIEALKRHISGAYGYFEKGVYYNNKDVEKLIRICKANKDGKYRECFNHYRIVINEISDWDGRGYNNIPYINVYNGLEIAKHFSVKFNDASQWSVGDIISNSDIIVKYDKSIDKDNCILMIRNYQYTADDDYYIEYDEEDADMEMIDKFLDNIDKKFLVDEVELRGTFTEVLIELRNYLNNMCEIFNIEKVF